MRLYPAFCLVGVLAACEPTPPTPAPGPALPLLGGFRDPADPCRRVGESPATAPFLDAAADLAACPEGAENVGVFVTETGAVEVARLEGFILFSVPRA